MIISFRRPFDGRLVFANRKSTIGVSIYNIITFWALARLTLQRPSGNTPDDLVGHVMTRHLSHAMALNVKMDTSPKKPTPMPYSSHPAYRYHVGEHRISTYSSHTTVKVLLAVHNMVIIANVILYICKSFKLAQPSILPSR